MPLERTTTTEEGLIMTCRHDDPDRRLAWCLVAADILVAVATIGAAILQAVAN